MIDYDNTCGCENVHCDGTYCKTEEKEIVNLEERYSQYTVGAPEERVKTVSNLAEDVQSVLFNLHKSSDYYLSRNGLQASDLVAVVSERYVKDVLLNSVSGIYTQTGLLKIVYEIDESWAYAGDGYYPGCTQIASITVMPKEHFNKYRRLGRQE